MRQRIRRGRVVSRGKRVAGTLVLLVVASTLASGSSAGADYWRKCGDGNRYWYDVHAHGLYCRKARAVAHAWTLDRDGEFTYTGPAGYVPGWNCREYGQGYESSNVHCSRIFGGKRQRVKFAWVI